MAVEIFSGIKGIEIPKFDWTDRKTSIIAEEKYYDELRKECKKNSKHKNIGKVIRFPVADGNAEYMVYGMRPLELIHIALGDAWHSETAELMTVAAVNKKITQQEALTALFSKKS